LLTRKHEKQESGKEVRTCNMIYRVFKSWRCEHAGESDKAYAGSALRLDSRSVI